MGREEARRRISMPAIKCAKQISTMAASTIKGSTDLVVEILMRYVRTRIS
jgi:hypothetical protein